MRASAIVRAIEAGDGAASAPVALELSPGRAMAGRMADDSGAALADVPVRIESDGQAPGEDPLPTLVTSDRAGKFSALRRSRAATACPPRAPATC